MKTGRNEPCPCGSGKKYKHCHIGAQTAAALVETDNIAAQRKAHEWLEARFGKSIQQEITDEFLGFILDTFSDEPFESQDDLSKFLDSLDEGGQHVLETGLNDWALHQTQYQRHGVQARGIDWVLKTNDIRWSAPQRAFLEATAQAPLRLYEVTAVEVDTGLRLRDLCDPGQPERFVHEVSATHGLHTGRIIGTRVIALDGRHALGGMIYPLSLTGAVEILSELTAIYGPTGSDALDGCDANEVDHAEEHTPQSVLAGLIRDNWLHDRQRPAILRTLPGTSYTAYRDIFHVLDPDALRDALDACADVKALPGGSWIRSLTAHDDVPSVLITAAFDDDGQRIPDQVALHNQTTDAADLARAWFERIVDTSVSHQQRSATSIDMDRFHAPSVRLLEESTEANAALTADQRGAAAQHWYAQTYAPWSDTPLPIFDNRTPRAMLAEPGDRIQLELLLRLYDDLETAVASYEKREPLTFDFLRHELGLAPAEHGAAIHDNTPQVVR